MTLTSAFRGVDAWLACASALWLSACAVPLGPGYTIEQQQIEVHFVSAPEPHLEVRASYRLKNTGSQQLSFLVAGMPDARAYGREKLHVQLDGREIAPQTSSDSQGDRIRIPFDPPLLQKQKRELVVAYDLAAGAASDYGMAFGQEAFYLKPHGWYPDLLPPKGAFAKGGERPGPAQVTARVPRGFLALSSGRAIGPRKRNGETEYRFRSRQEDSDPFVVAGAYQEQRFASSGNTVVFWTHEPVEPAAAQRAAARLAAALATFQATFGPLTKRPQPFWFVETRAPAWPCLTGPVDPAGRSFPGGILFNRQAFALGVTSEDFLEFAERELARTWFGHLLAPRQEAKLLLGEGICGYAVVVAEAARGGEAQRRRHAALLLRRYDEARQQAAEKPLLAPLASFSRPERDVAADKATLFFLALEDQYGKETLRRGLARLVSSLRGREVGYEELRAALENETGRNLADFSRVWLNGKGIPTDFRARYEGKIEPKE